MVREPRGAADAIQGHGRARNKNQIPRNRNQIRRNENQIPRNENQIGRNENQMTFRVADPDFSTA
jgi:hypothetical protein